MEISSKENGRGGRHRDWLHHDLLCAPKLPAEMAAVLAAAFPHLVQQTIHSAAAMLCFPSFTQEAVFVAFALSAHIPGQC